MQTFGSSLGVDLLQPIVSTALDHHRFEKRLSKNLHIGTIKCIFVWIYRFRCLRCSLDNKADISSIIVRCYQQL